MLELQGGGEGERGELERAEGDGTVVLTVSAWVREEGEGRREGGTNTSLVLLLVDEVMSRPPLSERQHQKRRACQYCRGHQAAYTTTAKGIGAKAV